MKRAFFRYARGLLGPWRIVSWEQRKLGEFADITTGKLDANAMKPDGEYDFYTSGVKKYHIDWAAFEGPAITIAGNGATVGYMHLADGKFNAYQRTYVLTGILADRRYLFSEIGNRLPAKIQEEARMGNIPYIVLNMLTELDISLPTNSDEQHQIGTIFDQLDNLITLHQREPSIDPKEGDNNVVSIQLRRAVLRLLQEVGCNIQRGGHQKSNHAEIPINLRLARSLDSQFKSSEPQSRRISTAS